MLSPDDGSKPVKEGVYSEAQKRMVEMYDDKKKKDKEEKDKISSMMTKDSVKKEDEKEEEKPDMRSKYAMINIIKNKLRAAGQRDPMVMAVDACEERTPAKKGEMGAEYMEKVKKGIEASKKKGSKPATGSKPDTPAKPAKKVKPYNPYGENATATPENMAPGKP